MKKVAKLLLIDPNKKYLLLHRNNHPVFGNDPDLPGGTIENYESLCDAMLREVKEETGISIMANNVRVIYSGAEFSKNGTHYTLFTADLEILSTISISWEHSYYEWLDKEDFLTKIQNSKDTYMHMVFDVITQNHKI